MTKDAKGQPLVVGDAICWGTKDGVRWGTVAEVGEVDPQSYSYTPAPKKQRLGWVLCRTAEDSPGVSCWQRGETVVRT